MASLVGYFSWLEALVGGQLFVSEVLPRGWENGVFELCGCCCIFVSVHWVKIIMNECLEQ